MTHLYDRQLDGPNYLRYLNFWQLGLGRIFGPRGLLAAAAVSLVLLLTGVLRGQMVPGRVSKRAARRGSSPRVNVSPRSDHGRRAVVLLWAVVRLPGLALAVYLMRGPIVG